MYNRIIGFTAVFAVCAAVSAQAATPAGTLGRDSLLTSQILNRLSIGADVTYMNRGFDLVGAADTNAEARISGVYVGVDVLSWLTVFGTVGMSQVKESGVDGGYWSSGTKWSLGVAPNIWETDLRRPWFMTGKLSLAATAEFGMYESSKANSSADWSELSAGLLVRYEVTEDAPWSADSATSLRLSAGPMVSVLSGHWRDASPKSSVRAKDVVGWTASAEWFIAPTLSVAGSVETFDETSVSGSLRIHF